MAKKTWIEKLEAKGQDLPKIVKLNEKQQKRLKAKEMVVPHPKDIYEIMKKIPKGNLITVKELRDILAAKYNTQTTCPLTTGIFIWIAANASIEQNNSKGEPIIPFWRTLKAKGELVAKYPGGLEKHKELLENEGFAIIKKGKKFFVDNYQKFIIPIV